MIVKRPTDNTSILPKHPNLSEKEWNTQINIRNECIVSLTPLIYVFVEASYREGLDDPAERAKKDIEDWKETINVIETEYPRERIEGEEEDKELMWKIIEKMKDASDMTEEEVTKINEDIDAELIRENCYMAASAIWQSIIYEGTKLFKKSGPQSIDVLLFLGGVDFARFLIQISEKYYTTIKMTLVLCMPEIFRKGFICQVEGRYMEMLFQEISGRIILREVSYETFRTWANC